MNVPLRASDLIAAIQEFITEHGDLVLTAEVDERRWEPCVLIDVTKGVSGRCLVRLLDEAAKTEKEWS